jgi:microcystin-dependent protein
MPALNFLITNAGKAAIAASGSIGPVVLSQVAIGSSGYTATGSQTALVAQIKQITPEGSSVPTPGTIHITASDSSADSYTVREVGLITSTGTLFAIYSQTAPILIKGSGSVALFALDFVMTGVPAGSVTIGSASFQYPPASETAQGVAEIATQAETDAGTDNARFITPLKLAALNRWVLKTGDTMTGPLTTNGNFTVNGSIRNVQGTLKGAADNSAWSIVAGSSDPGVATSGAWISLYGGTAAGSPGLMVFGCNSATTGVITAAGNVGFGTTAPLAKLHVVGESFIVQNTGAPVDRRITRLSNWSNGAVMLERVNDAFTAGTQLLGFDGNNNAAIPGALILGGPLTLPADPTAALHAATKQYIDGLLLGMITTFPQTTEPVGWLKCNGQAVSRATYAALFARIGTTYGVGNGSTTFNLPDLRGEFVRGLDEGRGADTGRTLGSAQADMLEAHSHNVGAFTTSASNTGQGVFSFYSVTSHGGGSSFNGYTTSSNGGTETRPRNVAFPYFIKF